MITLWSMAKHHAKKDGVPLDFTREELAILLDAAIISGDVVAEKHRPNTASLDRRDPLRPLSRDNVQILPQWLNYAYHDFDKREVDDLILRRARTKG